MANNFNISNAAAIRLADAFDDEVNKGTAASEIDIRDGAQPADPDTAVGAQVLLATLTFDDPAFGGATDAAPGALLTAGVITSDSSANATGTAAWFRIRSVTTTPDDVADGTVGTATSDLIMNTTSITAGSTVSITSFLVTMPEG